MIVVYRLGGAPIFINPDLIMFFESTPDTVITFRGGGKLPVKDTIEQLNQKILKFKKSLIGSEQGEPLQQE